MLQFSTYYHIYNHANGDDNLFREAKNYDFFLNKYHQHIDPIADTIAWCLMPNHFHLLVKIKSGEEVASNFSKVQNFRKVENDGNFRKVDNFHLRAKIKSEEVASNFSKVQNFRKVEDDGNFRKVEDKSKFLSKRFSNLFSSYTQAFNKVYQRRGSLFIKNFKRKEITNEQYLLSCILYIHLNPVKHGFVGEVENWKHSSFQQFPGQNPKLLDWLFGTEQNYFEIHQNRNNNFNDYRNLEDDLT